MLADVQPWNKGTSPSEVEQAIALSSEALRICGVVLQPFMPTKAAELLDSLGVPADEREWRHSGWLKGSAGTFAAGKVLFPRDPKSQ